MLPLFLLFLSTIVKGQTDTSKLKSSQLKANLNFIGASASYELRIARNTTLYTEAMIDGGFNWSSNFGWGYALTPGVAAQVRQYYNLRKRESRGKSIRNNAGNFFTLGLQYRFDPIAYDKINNNAMLVFTPAWGFQRNLGKRFSFETLLGLDFGKDLVEDQDDTTLHFRLKFGYVLR